MANDNQGGAEKMVGGYPLSSWIKSIIKHVAVYGAILSCALFALLVLNK